MHDELEILLVEDDADTRDNLMEILQLDGHRIRVASSFAQVRAGGNQPNVALVILDRHLPDGDAEDVLPELKTLLPGAEFIVVTGYADMENTIAAIKLGVVDYILKPVNPKAIRKSVDRIVRQKRTERELSREQRFANEVLVTAEAIILVLDLDGSVVHFNPYFHQIAGWNLDDVRGKDWFANCVPDKDCDRVRKVFIETAHDIHSSGVLNQIRTSDGHQRFIRWSNTTLKNEVGEVDSILAIGVDVTDLLSAQEASSQSHRLAAIGQTVAGLAHESRNALHRIQASVELLKLDIPPGSESREEVDSIQRASVELQNALEEVREYAAPIHLHREPGSLPELWRRVWGYLASSRRDRDAELVETICGCDCCVDIDVLRVEQLFRNLFENALAACSDPVRIHLNCSCDGPDWILLDIQDNGPGLSAEQRERLFEPFFTTKFRGTGLGMSIVQRIVDAHGGTIQIADPKGNGARFLIRLSKHDSALRTACQPNEVPSDALT